MRFVFTKAKRRNHIHLPVSVEKGKNDKEEILNKLRSFLDREEPKIVKWLLSFWDKQQETITYKELREAYLNGYITKSQIQKWREEYSKLVTRKLLPQWENAVIEAADWLREYSNFYYIPGSEEAIEYIRSHGAELVTQLTEEQKGALNAMITQGTYYDASTADELSRIMRSCIGLTVHQSKANLNYYNGVKAALLKSGLKESDAKKKAADKAAKYAGKQHRYRAMNIARTELASAYNRGGYFAVKEAQTMGYMGKAKKVWLTANDERVCPICGTAEGEEQYLQRSFSSGVLLPPAHPSCRCAVAYEEVEAIGTLTGNIEGKDNMIENIPQMGVVNDTLREYTQEEINKIAYETDKIASKYVDIKSKWSGNIIIANEKGRYGKLWNCDISTRVETAPHIILHEQLHARSISYFNNRIYAEYSNIEEASVQFLTQEISKLENISIIESEYDDMTNALRKINKKLKLRNNDFIFAKELFEIPVIRRLEWLEEIVYNNVDRNIRVNDFMEIRKLLNLLYNQ